METTGASLVSIPSLTVQISVTQVSGGVQVNCFPNPLPVEAGKKYVVLDFVLITEGYEFAASGAIVVVDVSTQFPLASFTESSTRARLFDFNFDERSTSYHYNVGLKNLPQDNIFYIPAQGPVIQNGV